MTLRAALIDLGGTLVDFMGHGNAAQVIPLSLRSVSEALTGLGRDVPSPTAQEGMWNGQRRDPNDLMARPLEERLANVFGIDPADHDTIDAACRAFMLPLYRQARRFDDAVPFLEGLRARGVRSVLVSNTTWGSPSHLWREEVARHGLGALLDDMVFCRDVGWRKPDPRIFACALAKAGASPADCLFVGDDPWWDVEGPMAVGIPAVLLDRRSEWIGQGYERVTNLEELVRSGILDR